jgi:hypothetical protein
MNDQERQELRARIEATTCIRFAEPTEKDLDKMANHMKTPEELHEAASYLVHCRNAIGSSKSEVMCHDFTFDLNPIGMIDDAYAERVNRCGEALLVKLSGGGWWLTNNSPAADFSCDVLYQHQVAKILSAYGMEVPE